MTVSIAAVLKLLVILIGVIGTVTILVFIIMSITHSSRRWKECKPIVKNFIEQRFGQKIVSETFVISLPDSMDIRMSDMVWFAFTRDYVGYCSKDQVVSAKDEFFIFVSRKSDIELNEMKPSGRSWRNYEFKAQSVDDPTAIHTLTLYLDDKHLASFTEHIGKRYIRRYR